MILKIVLGAVVAVCAAVAAVGGAFYFGLISPPFWLAASEPEESARLYPPDVVAYAWFTASPGIGQLRHAGDTLARLGELSEFERLTDEAEDALEDEIGVDFENDLAPWIGPGASIALFDLDGGDGAAEVAAVFEVRDRAAAESALDKHIEFEEDVRGMDFARESIDGFSAWADESANLHYALSDSLMIFATARSAMRDVIRRAGGGADARTLADDADFQAARAAMPDRRFMSAYLDLNAALDSLWASGAETMGYPYADADAYGDCMDEFFPSPDWMAGSAGWVERGVAFDFVSPSTASLNMPAAPPLADAAAILPSDTLAFMSFAFDPVLDNWRAALAEYPLAELAECVPDADYYADAFGLDMSGDLADLLDEALDALNTAAGIDVESDLLDNLGGQAALAVGAFDFGEVGDNPEQAPIRAAASLSLREGADGEMQSLMDDILQDAQFNYGLQLQETDVGAERPAMVYPIEGTRYAPGAVVSGGYLTFGTTRAALRDMADIQAGREPALSSDPEYARAISHLPDDRQWTLYIDLRRVMDGVDRADADMTREQLEALETVAGAIAMSGSQTDGYDRATMVLTLFGE